MYRKLRFVLLLSWYLAVVQAGSVTQHYYWRDFYFGDIPYDAIEIANDGKYIGQVHVDKGLIPTTIYPHLGYAIGELFGKKIYKEHIKILCSPDQSKLYWDLVDFDQPPHGQMKGAVSGGYYEAVNRFIGKSYHEGEWKVGKVTPVEDNWRGLLVWDTNEKPVRIMRFNMLRYNFTADSPADTTEILTCPT